MSRTPGSGWGGGVILYQKCPKCNKKKAMYDKGPLDIPPFRCTWCKETFYSKDLIRQKHV